MTLMSTSESLHIHPNQKENTRTDDKRKLLKTLNYTEVIANLYNYRGAVDEHNANRHDCGTKHGLSLEEIWKTTRWTHRVSAFILYLAMIYFGATQLELLKKLAFELIHNALESSTGEERPDNGGRRVKIRFTKLPQRYHIQVLRVENG